MGLNSKQEILNVDPVHKYKYKGECLSKKEIKTLSDTLLQKCKDTMNNEMVFQRNNLVKDRVFTDLNKMLEIKESNKVEKL